MSLVDEGWVRVGTRSELLPGEFKVVFDGDTPIAVYNLGGDLYAIEDVCTHDGGDLAGGEVFGFEVECPRHGARFDLRSGAVTRPPAVEPVSCFPVREEAGAIWTRDDR
ncbi:MULTISPECIES: non-heme iron oxygenase ferredoxin subunit [unclassified Rhodanobacter]|jgi:3-phenylpropionate/trans-cinnamate dioxygenase ferredoxin subunit|uniref:Non-heme iron oxygenase ferredoxin subunit n=1 Tax=Rhodanobacter humi TaxID=1888173 RepID=A0ABV4AM07_9GAMM